MRLFTRSSILGKYHGTCCNEYKYKAGKIVNKLLHAKMAYVQSGNIKIRFLCKAENLYFGNLAWLSQKGDNTLNGKVTIAKDDNSNAYMTICC